MTNKVILVFCVMSIFLFSFLGCTKSSPTSSTPKATATWTPGSNLTPGATITPTFTQTPSSTLYVLAVVTTENGVTEVVVDLQNGYGGPAVTGTVQVNGITIPAFPSGGYDLKPFIPELTAGAAVNLTVSTSIGNISASVNMPTLAAIYAYTYITGCDQNSVMEVFNE